MLAVSTPMKFPNLNPTFRSGRMALVWVSLASGVAAGAADERPTVMQAVTVSEPKTHMLFMGADIAVTLGGELYPVRDVVGASWVLLIGGQEKLISTKESS